MRTRGRQWIARFLLCEGLSAPKSERHEKQSLSLELTTACGHWSAASGDALPMPAQVVSPYHSAGLEGCTIALRAAELCFTFSGMA